MAQEAFFEAIHPSTPPERRQVFRDQLLRYCEPDTLAMVRVWETFSGSGAP